MFNSQVLTQYQTKIDQIMETLFPLRGISGIQASGVSTTTQGDKLEKAMEMLRGAKPKN